MTDIMTWICIAVALLFAGINFWAIDKIANAVIQLQKFEGDRLDAKITELRKSDRA